MNNYSSDAKARLARLEEEVQQLRQSIYADETSRPPEKLDEQFKGIHEQCESINALVKEILEQMDRLGEAFRTKKHEPIVITRHAGRK